MILVNCVLLPIVMNFLKNINLFIYLKSVVRGGETERGIFNLLVFSPGGHNGQGYASMNPATPF